MMKGRRFGYLLREIECKSRDYNKKTNKQTRSRPVPLKRKSDIFVDKKKKKLKNSEHVEKGENRGVKNIPCTRPTLQVQRTSLHDKPTTTIENNYFLPNRKVVLLMSVF